MRNLPLFYYPGTWLYVDDDKNLLGCMSLAFDDVARPKTFSSPTTCLDFLNNYVSPSNQQHFINSNSCDERFGALLHTAVDFNITQIADFSKDTKRVDEITAMVVDYHMPEMDGFSLSKACNHFSFEKILLTGQTEDEKVISGFNQNYIQHYIKKGSEDLEEKVIEKLKVFSFHYFQKITSPMLALLEAENPLPLSDSAFIDFFLSYIERKNIVEYYLLDKQGSFLCIDREGVRSYFIVHSDQSLTTWMKTYFTGAEFSPDFAEKIIDREKIPFFGQGVEAWQLDTAEWHTYFHCPEGVIEGREKYYWFWISDVDFTNGKKS